MYEKPIKMWNAKNTGHGLVATLEGHESTVNCLAMLGPDRLTSGSSDATIMIWDLAAKRCVATLKGHGEGVNCLAVLGPNRLAS